jgi:hypothetical protein
MAIRKPNYEDLSLECWDWFLEEVGIKYDDINQDDASTLDRMVSEGISLDECSHQIVKRMIRFWVGEINSWDDDIENNNWLGGLWNVLRPKEKDYE